MFIDFWTFATLSLFAIQYSYDIPLTPPDSAHISINNGTFTSCIYPSDKPFKESSKTYPRSELRLLQERPDGTYNVSVEILNIDTDSQQQYSLWQLFGNSPLLMIRYRNDQKQMVVFKGKPKIQTISQWPSSCSLLCGRNGYVKCDSYISYGRINCKNKLHLKIGAYSQQMQPTAPTCITYGNVSFIP